MGSTINPSLTLTANCLIPLAGKETSLVGLSALKDGVPVAAMELNREGFGHMSIPACSGQLPESGLTHYGSVGFFFGTDGALRILARNPDGTYKTYDL